MSNVLIIESSARQQDSISRQLTQQFISQWQAAYPADQITVRDVALNPVPHLDTHLLVGGEQFVGQLVGAVQGSLFDRAALFGRFHPAAEQMLSLIHI